MGGKVAILDIRLGKASPRVKYLGRNVNRKEVVMGMLRRRALQA